jgi:hypothetical protein
MDSLAPEDFEGWTDCKYSQGARQGGSREASGSRQGEKDDGKPGYAAADRKFFVAMEMGARFTIRAQAEIGK